MKLHSHLHAFVRRAIPARIRRLRGSDMEATFLAELERRRAESGWRGVAGAWGHEARDLLATGLTLRTRGAVRAIARSRSDGRPPSAASPPGGTPGDHRSRPPTRRGRAAGAAADLATDLVYCLRTLRRTPRITALIVAMLALGIGLNTAVFNVLHATVLAPFRGIEEPDRLVELVRGAHQRFSGPFNMRALEALRAASGGVFEAAAGFREAPVRISVDGAVVQAGATEVSPGIFELLGVAPALGRAFAPDEQGKGAVPVAIIAHELWEDGFASDPGVLGRTLRVDGVERTIVGVMPPGFSFYRASVLWLPLPVEAVAADQDTFRFSVIARLAPETGLDRARAAMAALREAVEPMIGEERGEAARLRRETPLTLMPLASGYSSFGMAAVGGIQQGVAGFVLLVLCANVAILLLARGAARRGEIAVRRALGASRGRLVRQLLTENLVLAAGGGAAGVLVAFWGHDLLVATLPERLLVGVEFVLHPQVLAFAVATAGLTVLAAGMAPALELSRLEPGQAVRDRAAGFTGSRRSRRRGNGLAVCQVALSLILLIGATLTVRTIFAFQRIDPGFDADNVLSVLLAPRDTGRDEEPPLDEVTERLIDRLETAPAVAAVGWYSNATPEAVGSIRERLGGFVETRNGVSTLPARDIGRTYNAGYFRSMGLRLLRGRLFDDGDRPGTPWVAVLSRRAAEVLFPDGDPVGRELRLPGTSAWITVVGVVSDVVRVRLGGFDGEGGGFSAEPWPDVYLASSQFDEPPNNQFLVRPAADHASVVQLVRTALAEVDPGRPVSFSTVWEQDYATPQRVYLLVGRILGVLGLVAVGLSALGGYSVISYTWTRRAREVGVRMALGATRGDVLTLVLRQSQRLALLGVLIGTAVSLTVYRLASSLFFETSPWDPIAYTAVSLLLLAVAAAAGLAPARRATRTDPAEVLRQE